MDRAQEFIETPPGEWERDVDGLDSGLRDSMACEIGWIAERAAQLAGYLAKRHGGGCGDQGHETAVKAANVAGKKVRFALEYNSYTPLVLPLRRK